MNLEPSQKKELDLSAKTFYKSGTWYSLTINLPDTLQHYGKLDRRKRCHDIFHEQCMMVFDSHKIPYIYVVELSEPRKIHQGNHGSRYHIHGRFLLPNRHKVHYFLDSGMYNLTRIGDVDIDTIDDLKCWDQYCNKNTKYSLSKPYYNVESVYTSFILNTKDQHEPYVTGDCARDLDWIDPNEPEPPVVDRSNIKIEQI